MTGAVRTLGSGFLRASELHPDHPAVEVGGREHSYRELRELAARIAATLAAEVPGDDPPLTAVHAHRSIEAPAGILGALLRGHGYVPLNPAFPPARSRAMLERSRVRALVAESSTAGRLSEVLAGFERPLVLLFPEAEDGAELARRFPRQRVLARADLRPAQAWRPRPVDPNGIAYMLFTSGSTGVPKGVMVAHRNVTPFLDAMVERCSIRATDRLSQTFDLSVFDLFVAWEGAACVCLPTTALKMLPGKYIQQSRLTVWFSVPSTGALMSRLRMLAPGKYPDLRVSLFCGEALPVELAQAWTAAAPASIVENLYGPTELTIACTLYRWDPERSPAECMRGLVPIGEPYPGMDVLVADEALREVAPGESGELLMSGPQMSPGYWDDPERTAAAFVTPPGRDRVFYRTGDRVRRPRAGEPLVYLGRVDQQVKIQGYRVELGEIEAIVREQGGVGRAIAIDWPRNPSGADGVVVFLDDERVDRERVAREIRHRLPDYMEPREIRAISEFPLNANSKVDRGALLRRLEEQG